MQQTYTSRPCSYSLELPSPCYLSICLCRHGVVNASDSERDFQLLFMTGTVGFKRIDKVDASTPKYYSHVYAKEN
jgi:hypothetical protein